MWRIAIEWEFISPTLRCASGTLHLEKFRSGMADQHPIISHTWMVRIEDGRLGQSGYIPNLNEEMKSLISSMLHSYFDGLTLNDRSFEWSYADNIYEFDYSDNIDEDYMI